MISRQVPKFSVVFHDTVNVTNTCIGLVTRTTNFKNKKNARRLKNARYSTTCYEYIEARGGYLLRPRNGVDMLLETQQTFVSKRFFENKTAVFLPR